MTLCPCASGQPYAACCARLHAGAEPAATAEALMRSRYSAYVLGLEAYLLATWHRSTRPAALHLADEVGTKWQGLAVKRHQALDETHAVVEFVARYRVAGRGHRLHEISNFVREDGCWFYVDGNLNGGAA
ncbi:YchJ family protein [Dechloromonas sp. A34]|uniref:YchJ family protein n=1 Tax=Dechloromonas sp. A34 TaxID=447588 RepID=UPI002248FBC3|nr:YchJ family metal-binding protein [Dechloromonas sp. A34]